MQYVDEPVLVLTTDNITELDIDFLTAEYLRVRSPACMLVPVVPIPMIEGDYIDHENGLVTGIQRQAPKDIYCSGIQVLNPSKVASVAAGADDFYAVWNALIERKQLWVSRIYPKPWFSIDTLEQLANLNGNLNGSTTEEVQLIPVVQV
jgi:NDP-sugar pyrophosphorylase family protein